VPIRLTIGEFSKITHLSVRTLRRYHEDGLLEPAQVDTQTGYRYYSIGQVPTAQVIRRFRDLDLPVREVRALITTGDLEARRDVIAQHLERLEGQLAQTQATVTAIRRLLSPSLPPLSVDYRTVPEMLVAAIPEIVGRGELVTWYDAAMVELNQTLALLGRTPTDPYGGLYDHEIFVDERGTAIVFAPLADPPTKGRVRPRIVPAVELAVTVHSGHYHDADITYGMLGTYVTEQALAVAGPLRETYLVGPRETHDDTAWRTEIGWPVFLPSGTPHA